MLEEKALIAPLKEMFLTILQRYRMATSYFMLVFRHWEEYADINQMKDLLSASAVGNAKQKGSGSINSCFKKIQNLADQYRTAKESLE